MLRLLDQPGAVVVDDSVVGPLLLLHKIGQGSWIDHPIHTSWMMLTMRMVIDVRMVTMMVMMMVMVQSVCIHLVAIVAVGHYFCDQHDDVSSVHNLILSRLYFFPFRTFHFFKMM